MSTLRERLERVFQTRDETGVLDKACALLDSIPAKDAEIEALNARVAELEDITKGVDWAKWHDALEIQCALESHQALLAQRDALAATCKLLAEALENVGHADDCGPDRPMTLEEWRNRECTCGRDAALAAYHATKEKP